MNNEQNQASILLSYISEGAPEDIVKRYQGLAQAAAQAEYGPFDNNIVVVDTETTGLTLDQDELMQIAAARVEGGRVVDWYITFVDPGRFIPDDVMRLTNIHETDLIGAPSPAEAVTRLVEFVGDATLVAHNATFDRSQITKHPEGAVLRKNLWIDTLDLARIALPRLKSFRLTDLVHAFGTVESSHRADDDVAATCAVLRILLAGCDALPDDLLVVISNLATREQWPTGEVFRYFARRHLEAQGRSLEDALARLQNKGFSVRGLRNQRTRVIPVPRVHKVDAAFSVPAEEPQGIMAAAFAQAGLARKYAAQDYEQAPAEYAYPLQFAGEDEITAAFSPDGIVGEMYDDYESRDEQLIMALAVNRAFAHSENLAVEAGTGVGKSMAYLVPSVYTARKSNITVGVATKTNALLDQLVFHELPSLSRAMQAHGEQSLSWAALKGIAHYPCLRKIDILVNSGVRTVYNDGEIVTSAAGTAALLSFVSQSTYDDADGLHFDPRLISRYDFTSSPTECLRRKCPYFDHGCFAHGARRAAENVDIVVTNQSLLFSDLQASGALLPPIRYWVVDEAHGAEAEVRNAFSVELSSEELLRLAERAGSDDTQKNLFSRALQRDPRCADQVTKALDAAKPFLAAAKEYARQVKSLKKFAQGQRTSRTNGGETVWLSADMREETSFQLVAASGKYCMKLAGLVMNAADKLLAKLVIDEAPMDLQNEVGVFCYDMRACVQAADVVFGPTDPRYVYSAVIVQKADKLTDRLCAQVIDVGDTLDNTLYKRTHSVIFTSATLTVGESFDSFERAMGLNRSEASFARTLQLDSSFDFDHNMVIYVPTDIPEYKSGNTARYMDKLDDLLVRVHRATQGGLLTLFANRADMEACYQAVQPELQKDGLVLDRQRAGASIKGLQDMFIRDKDASLFALKSFWAGFDAPGETLRGVIIPKLPFIPPTDPLSRERDQRDSNAWTHYVLSAAIIETRQAVGRLIRKADDKGIVILADSRILTKGYGRTVLRSMPTSNIKCLTCDEIVADIERANWADRKAGTERGEK